MPTNQAPGTDQAAPPFLKIKFPTKLCTVKLGVGNREETETNVGSLHLSPGLHQFESGTREGTVWGLRKMDSYKPRTGWREGWSHRWWGREAPDGACSRAPSPGPASGRPEVAAEGGGQRGLGSAPACRSPSSIPGGGGWGPRYRLPKVSFKHFNTQLAQKSLRDLAKEKITLTLTDNKC